MGGWGVRVREGRCVKEIKAKLRRKVEKGGRDEGR